MTDFLTTLERSARMSLIRGSGNKSTEMRMLTLFRAERIIGWRRGSKLLGKPDFVFPKLRLAVFVDGCFWHGCPLHGTVPASNKKFWREKIARNKERDRIVNRKLRALGWRVLRVWEHELAEKRQPKLVKRLRALI